MQMVRIYPLRGRRCIERLPHLWGIVLPLVYHPGLWEGGVESTGFLSLSAVAGSFRETAGSFLGREACFLHIVGS